MRKGFTLIELLLVVVVIGILAGFVLPKFGDIKTRAQNAALQNDLRNLVNQQEFYFDAHGTYAADVDALVGYATSKNVTVTISGASGQGYTAEAQHDNNGAVCQIEMGPLADQKIKCGDDIDGDDDDNGEE